MPFKVHVAFITADVSVTVVGSVTAGVSVTVGVSVIMVFVT